MTFTYAPKKYFKNVMYNNTGDFNRDFLAFSQCIYRNIETAKIKTKTKKYYKGILRNSLGLDEMINFLFNDRLITVQQYTDFNSNYDNQIRLMDSLKNVYRL
jgi:hypothetical protein